MYRQHSHTRNSLEGMKGAGYVYDILYSETNGTQEEFEIPLRKGSEYRIIKAQIFKGKPILVVEWMGGKA